MEPIKLRSQDIEYLGIHYPDLAYDSDNDEISGKLSFDLEFEEVEEPPIQDCYGVLIKLDDVSSEGFPKINETEGRILQIAKNNNMNKADLHLNDLKGEMCIIIPAKVKERYPNGFELREFLYHVEEHLYWVSYYEKFNKAPWAEYGHGEKGYVQLYIEDRSKYSEEVKKYFNYLPKAMFERKIKKLRKKYRL